MRRTISDGYCLGLALLVAMLALAACTASMPVTPPAAPSSVPKVPPAPSLPPSSTAPVSLPATATPTPGTPSAQHADEMPVLEGSVIRVIDGDTIKVQLSSGPITVRLASIDAPEHDQPGGDASTAALARRLNGRPVELEVQAQDQYERLVAFVYLGGENVNSWQVQQGHAWAYRQYMSDPRYCVWEADARTYRRGLWSALPGSQQAPWEWRRSQKSAGAFVFTDYQRETVADCVRAMRQGIEHRAGQAPSAGSGDAPSSATPVPAAAGACLIKGNISESGRIYHVPGSAWYERTQIDTRRGERWFCTEQEARAAGWRAPRG